MYPIKSAFDAWASSPAEGRGAMRKPLLKVCLSSIETASTLTNRTPNPQ